MLSNRPEAPPPSLVDDERLDRAAFVSKNLCFIIIIIIIMSASIFIVSVFVFLPIAHSTAAGVLDIQGRSLFLPNQH